MKIIARSAKGYIVEATGDELLRCAGVVTCKQLEEQYPSTAKLSKPSSYSYDWSLGIGCEIDVVSIFTWVQKLREQEQKILASAEILGSLSEMLKGGIPSSVVPDETP